MSSTFMSDFTTGYMDPTEVYAKLGQLAAEFPNISELITLPNETNGYQRRAQALMAGAFDIGVTPNDETRPGERGRPHLPRVGPRGRERHQRRVPQPDDAGFRPERQRHGQATSQ